MQAAGEQDDQGPVHDVEKLGGVADGGGERQGVKELVERREAAQANQEGDDRHAAPEPDELSLPPREHRLLAPQRLQHCPQRNQHHQRSRIHAAAAIANEAGGRGPRFAGGEVAVPLRVASAGAPVAASQVIVLQALRQVHGGIHAVAKQAGHKQAERFAFGHAPLGGGIPALGFAGLVLAHAGHALDLGADQGADGRCGDECRERGHHRQPPHAPGRALRPRAFAGPRLPEHKARNDQAENGPDVKGFHHAQADGQAGQGGAEPAPGRGEVGQRRQGQEVQPEAQGLRGHAPAGGGKEVRVQRHGEAAQETGPGGELPLAEAQPGAQAEKQQRERRVDFRKEQRPGQQRQPLRDVRRSAGPRAAEPVEVAPVAEEARGQPGALRADGAERAVVGKDRVARAQAIPEEHGQQHGQAERDPQELPCGRRRNAGPAFRLIHSAEVFFISG